MCRFDRELGEKMEGDSSVIFLGEVSPHALPFKKPSSCRLLGGELASQVRFISLAAMRVILWYFNPAERVFIVPQRGKTSGFRKQLTSGGGRRREGESAAPRQGAVLGTGSRRGGCRVPRAQRPLPAAGAAAPPRRRAAGGRRAAAASVQPRGRPRTAGAPRRAAGPRGRGFEPAHGRGGRQWERGPPAVASLSPHRCLQAALVPSAPLLLRLLSLTPLSVSKCSPGGVNGAGERSGEGSRPDNRQRQHFPPLLFLPCLS